MMKRYSQEETGPAILVDWYRAAAYCNWLSQREGIPEDQWCYETDARELSQERVSVLVSLLWPQDPLARGAGTRYLLDLPQVSITEPTVEAAGSMKEAIARMRRMFVAGSHFCPRVTKTTSLAKIARNNMRGMMTAHKAVRSFK